VSDPLAASGIPSERSARVIPSERQRVEGSALRALCSGLRVRAVASIHFGGETRLARPAAAQQPSDPACVDARSRRTAPNAAFTHCLTALARPGELAVTPLFWSKNVDRSRFSDGRIP